MTEKSSTNLTEFENFHIGVALVDPGLKIIETNPAFCTICRITRDELKNRPFTSLCHDSDVETITEQILKMEKGETNSFNAEIRFFLPDRTSRWGELNVSAVRDSDNKIIRSYFLLEDITLRRQLDMELIESEKKFRALFTSSKDAISIFNDKQIIDCNDSLCQLLEAPKEVITAADPKNFAPQVQPDGTPSEEMMNRQIDLALNGSDNHFEWDFLTHRGKSFTAEVKLSPLELSGTHFIQAVIRDISEKKKMQQAQEKSEQRLKRLIENGEEIITIVSQTGERLFLSANVDKITGYQPEELKGGSTFSLVHPDDLPVIKDLFFSLSGVENAKASAHYRVRSKSGEWLIFESTGRNLVHDPLIQGIVVNSRDVTERIKFSENLNMYKNIVSTSKELMAYFDAEENLLVCNDSFSHMFNLPSPGEEKLSLETVFPGEEVLAGIRKTFSNCLMGREVHTITWYDRESEKILLDISMYPFRDSDGKVSGVVMNCRNTTRELQQEMEVLTSTERERKKIGIELHDGLSHELLGLAIKSRILADRLNDMGLEESKEAVEIEKKLNEAISTTRGMAHGLFPVNLEKTGLDGLLKETAIMLEEQKGITCTLDVSGPAFISDQKAGIHVHNILQECAVNIMKHSEAKNVSISMEDETDFVTVKINDNGKGFQEKDTDSGMGLNIMNYRARLIGAELRITGEPKKGTTLTLRIPGKYFSR